MRSSVTHIHMHNTATGTVEGGGVAEGELPEEIISDIRMASLSG